MWKPLLELLFLQQGSSIFASYLVEIDLAMIALSCHFALDLIGYKECVYDSAWCFMGTIVHGVSICCGTIAILATS